MPELWSDKMLRCQMLGVCTTYLCERFSYPAINTITYSMYEYTDEQTVTYTAVRCGNLPVADKIDPIAKLDDATVR
jgi:hypothetical protein